MREPMNVQRAANNYALQIKCAGARNSFNFITEAVRSIRIYSNGIIFVKTLTYVTQRKRRTKTNQDSLCLAVTVGYDR